MIIPIKELVELAARQAESYSEAMHEPLYIVFETGKREVKDEVTYECKDGSQILLNMDASGVVLGIEID